MVSQTLLQETGPSALKESQYYCRCYRLETPQKDCWCGAEDKGLEWGWDESESPSVQFADGGREVRFHSEFSCGTAAVRGTKAMGGDRQYFWEIKMITPVYGTDMMVGMGLESLNLNEHGHNFCSMLGRRADSWGYSYLGTLYHDGEVRNFSERYDQGTLIGIHLDLWNGVMNIYKDRQFLGVAFKGLKGKKVYPMACSTAARSGMRLLNNSSCNTSLLYLCARKLRRMIPRERSVLDCLQLPPGLESNLRSKMGWLLCAVSVPGTVPEAHELRKRGSPFATTETGKLFKRPVIL